LPLPVSHVVLGFGAITIWRRPSGLGRRPRGSRPRRPRSFRAVCLGVSGHMLQRTERDRRECTRLLKPVGVAALARAHAYAQRVSAPCAPLTARPHTRYACRAWTYVARHGALEALPSHSREPLASRRTRWARAQPRVLCPVRHSHLVNTCRCQPPPRRLSHAEGRSSGTSIDLLLAHCLCAEVGPSAEPLHQTSAQLRAQCAARRRVRVSTVHAVCCGRLRRGQRAIYSAPCGRLLTGCCCCCC
jgi:hypothetical protein